MHPMLNIAVKAARRAGQIINRASLDLDRIQVSKKQHNDFVTEVDKASEAAIIETLTTAYPDHSILAEESGPTSSTASSITACRSRSRTRASSRRPWSTIRRATISSPHRAAAARI
jgi:fructose-1,6-bisphosphatase/inositol monophosphatase family enzyme